MSEFGAAARRTAVVHEWLDVYAGAERVLEQMLHVFPNSDCYALVDWLPDDERAWLGDVDVTTSLVQRLPFCKSHFRHYLALMPVAAEQWDFTDYDLILSSSYAVTKGIISRPDQLHVSYVHTPIRYAWDMQHQYLAQANTNRATDLVARLVMHYLRMWDRASASRADAMIANSNYVASRIWKTYRRHAYVVHPPVDVNAFTLRQDKDDYYVTASRLVPYKRVDLLVDAFAKMPSRKLVVIGTGPEFDRLRSRCPVNVELKGHVNHAVLDESIGSARAFLTAADEDFGITTVEAQACGTPVIAYGTGGHTETVVPGITGEFFETQSVGAIVGAVERFESRSESFEPDALRSHAEQFHPDRFRAELATTVDQLWARFAAGERDLDANTPQTGPR